MEEEHILDLDKVAEHIESHLDEYIEAFIAEHNLYDVDVEMSVSCINGSVSVMVEHIEQTFN